MAKGGALQAGRLRGQGLRLKLKGVTKGASSQAVERLDSDPKGGFEERESEGCMSWQTVGTDRNISTQESRLITAFSAELCG